MKFNFCDSLKMVYWKYLLNPLAKKMFRMKCEPKTFAKVFRLFPFQYEATMFVFKQKYPNPDEPFRGM